MPQFILNIGELQSLLASASSVAEKKAIRALWIASEAAQKLAAKEEMRKSSLAIVSAMADVDAHISALSASSGLGAERLENMRGELEAILRELSLPKTYRSGDGAVAPVDDEGEAGVPPSEAPEALPAAVEAPEAPMRVSDFATIADEYVRYFQTLEVRPKYVKAVEKMTAKALSLRSTYQEIEAEIGAPWWFVAGVHQMESTYGLKSHLHNGDPLTARTVRVPKGRPVGGAAPFSWKESALDALKGQKLDGLSDWSLPRALWRWERYNGFGYRKTNVPTPYLWSFSNHYTKGKYVSDGSFDGNAASAQCGAAVLLKSLQAGGHANLSTDLVEEAETGSPDAPAATDATPNIDAAAPATHDFASFFASKLGDVRHFAWNEFLFKGGSHAANGKNGDPPVEIWENVIPLVRLLDKFRDAVGAPVVLSSVYRSPAYNKAIGGVKRSQHMAFRAADLKVADGGATGPADWAARLRSMRDAGDFKGGIGRYDTFVHVDVRGFNADWSG